MNRQAMPDYQRAADAIRARIAAGTLRVGGGIKVPEIAELTGISYATARVVAKQLEADGILRAHQGKGYEVIATPEAAAAHQADTAELARQVTELREALGALAGRVDEHGERLDQAESEIESFSERLGYDLAPDGSSERGDQSATAARRGRAG